MTFSSGTYQQEFDQIVKEIHTAAADELVSKVVGQPRIPRLSLTLHFLYLKERRFSPNQIRDYCTSTTLVQMGLNIHSDVSTDDTISEPGKIRLRQLQVLAGDLFSGKFYQLLAHRGDIRVIRFLSEAICSINHAKTTFYDLLNKNQLTAKRYVREIEKICTFLFTSWLQHESYPHGGEWRRLTASLLTAERLLHDLHHSEHILHENHLVAPLKHTAQQLIAQSRQLVQNWNRHETKRELEHTIESYFPGGSDWGKTAEEC